MGNTILYRKYRPAHIAAQGTPVLRPDAQAYITALLANGASLTNPQQVAINTRFADIHGVANGSYTTYDISSRLVAMYPRLGGNAGCHKFNALNPIDTDGAYRTLFVGSPIHNSQGVKYNGSTQYCNNIFNASTAAADYVGLTIYLQEDGIATGGWNAGAYNSSFFGLQLYYVDNKMYIYANDSTGIGFANAHTKGCTGMQRISTSQGKAFRTGSLFHTFTLGAISRTNAALYSGALNLNGTGFTGAGNTLTESYFDILNGLLSDSEHQFNYNSIQALQTAFSRNV